MINMKGKDLLSIHDLSTEEVYQILKTAERLKLQQKIGEPHPLLKGKTLGMIFQKASTRTRVSFEVGMTQLGGHALYLNANDMQIGRGEPIKDTARVLSRYLDGIIIRTFAHETVVELAKYADIPVINALTDLLHPTQVLADLLTIKEKKRSLAGLKMAYIGDGNNMAHSYLFGCTKVGMDISIASPAGYMPNKQIVALAEADAAKSGSKITITNSPAVAVAGADVICTDVWASMGQEAEQKEREEKFVGFQVNSELVRTAKPDYLFLHCLPAHRGEEVSEEVLEGPNSVVFDEAENRLHAQKAIMALLM